MGNILQKLSGNRGSMSLNTPTEAKKPSDDGCEKSPAPLPVEQGTLLEVLFIANILRFGFR
jgi:hypothetical protein